MPYWEGEGSVNNNTRIDCIVVVRRVVWEFRWGILRVGAFIASACLPCMRVPEIGTDEAAINRNTSLGGQHAGHLANCLLNLKKRNWQVVAYFLISCMHFIVAYRRNNQLPSWFFAKCADGKHSHTSIRGLNNQTSVFEFWDFVKCMSTIFKTRSLCYTISHCAVYSETGMSIDPVTFAENFAESRGGKL